MPLPKRDPDRLTPEIMERVRKAMRRAEITPEPKDLEAPLPTRPLAERLLEMNAMCDTLGRIAFRVQDGTIAREESNRSFAQCVKACRNEQRSAGVAYYTGLSIDATRFPNFRRLLTAATVAYARAGAVAAICEKAMAGDIEPAEIEALRERLTRIETDGTAYDLQALKLRFDDPDMLADLAIAALRASMKPTEITATLDGISDRVEATMKATPASLA